MQKLFEELEDVGCEVEDTLERLQNDEELYLEFLLDFPANQNIIKLKKALAADDYQTAQEEVHTLKGIAANLGLLPLMDLTMDMLMEFREGNNDTAASFMPEIEESFNEICGIIAANK